MEQGLGMVRSGWRSESGWSKEWVEPGVGGARSGHGKEWV